MISKPSFGFLGIHKKGDVINSIEETEDWQEDLWDALFRTVKSMRHTETKFWLLTHPRIRRLIEETGRVPNMLVIPRRFRKFMLKRGWFRGLLVGRIPDAEVKCSNHATAWPVTESVDESTEGATAEDLDRILPLPKPLSDRSIPYSYGPLLEDDEIAERVYLAEKAYMREYKRKWDGVQPTFEAVQKSIKSKGKRYSPPQCVEVGPVMATRLWIKPVLEEFMDELEVDRGQQSVVTFRSYKSALLEKLEDPAVAIYRAPVITRNERKEFSFAPRVWETWERREVRGGRWGIMRTGATRCYLQLRRSVGCCPKNEPWGKERAKGIKPRLGDMLSFTA